MKAVKYASDTFASPRILYEVQYNAVPFAELDPSMQKLEGQVQMIVSNRVLHWIENKDLAVGNIFRLLKPGGMLYANISTLWNLFHDLPAEERQKYEKIIYIPSETEQIEQFRHLFQS